MASALDEVSDSHHHIRDSYNWRCCSTIPLFKHDIFCGARRFASMQPYCQATYAKRSSPANRHSGLCSNLQPSYEQAGLTYLWKVAPCTRFQPYQRITCEWRIWVHLCINDICYGIIREVKSIRRACCRLFVIPISRHIHNFTTEL